MEGAETAPSISFHSAGADLGIVEMPAATPTNYPASGTVSVAVASRRILPVFSFNDLAT
jgi:hypothetical protein